MYLGDYAEDYATLNFKFTTRAFATGVPTVLAGTPVIAVYKGSATGTEKTSAESYITLTVDFDSIVGNNHVLIDLSGDAFFATGEDYSVVITTGTVGGTSVVGETLATFSIENRWDEADVTKIDGAASAAANLNSACDNYSATRGLTGTALPAAAAAAAGGLPLSTAGGLEMDTLADWVNGGRLDLILDAILVDTDVTIPGLIAALNDLTAAQVNAEMVDVIETDTFTELTSPPAANAPLRDQLAWVFLMHRNKRTTTSTTDTVRNDADGADIGASTISDSAGTFTRGEYS